MSEPSLDVLAIGNAIVDVIARIDDHLLAAEHLVKGTMRLIDANEAHRLYLRMPPGVETSGGSAANTIAGLAALGLRTGFVGQVANDQLGEVFGHDIRALGVDFARLIRPRPAPGRAHGARRRPARVGLPASHGEDDRWDALDRCAIRATDGRGSSSDQPIRT